MKEGIGVDLGLKEFAVCSNGVIFKNFNKLKKIKNLEKKQAECRTNFFRRKYEKKIEAERIKAINKIVKEMVSWKPKFIALETLNLSGCYKGIRENIAKEKFDYFYYKLKKECAPKGIEIRKIYQFYPSSKLCSNCGYKKEDLTLADRTYTCSYCGYSADRDFNASCNIRDCKRYTVE